MSGHDVTDAGLEGDRGLAESPAGVDHPAGGVVEEGEQEGDAAAAVGVGQARSVHEVGLNTLQRGEELELQVLLAVRLPLAGRAVQAGRTHQPGQRGAGRGAGDATVGLQRAQRDGGGQLGVVLQVIQEHGRFGVGQGACASGIAPRARRQACSAVLAVEGQPLVDTAHRIASWTEARHLVLDLGLLPDQFPALGGGQVRVGQLGHQLVAELGDLLITVRALFWGHGCLLGAGMMTQRLCGACNRGQSVASVLVGEAVRTAGSKSGNSTAHSRAAPG